MGLHNIITNKVVECLFGSVFKETHVWVHYFDGGDLTSQYKKKQDSVLPRPKYNFTNESYESVESAKRELKQ